MNDVPDTIGANLLPSDTKLKSNRLVLNLGELRHQSSPGFLCNTRRKTEQKL